MKQRDENYLSMARSVQEVLNRHADVWNGMPRFAKAKEVLDGLLADIVARNASSKVVTLGATEDKADAKDEAIALAIKYSDLAQVYAKDTGNKELWQQLAVSEKRLAEIADTDTLALLRDMLSRLDGLGETLEEYAVSKTELERLSAAIGRYEAEINGPRDLTIQRKGHNASASQLVQDLRDNFRVLDRMIALWEVSDLETGYWNARIVVDHGRRKEQQEGV